MDDVSSVSEGDLDELSSSSSFTVSSYKPKPLIDNLDDLDDNLLHPQQTKRSGILRTKTTESQASTPYSIDTHHSLNSYRTLKELSHNEIEKYVTANALEGNTETVESLKEAEGAVEEGGERDSQNNVSSYVHRLPDINRPITHSSAYAILPDEYQMETHTGLVKLKTIETLRRETTRQSAADASSRSSNKLKASRSRSKSKSKSKSNTDTVTNTKATEEDPLVEQAKKMQLAIERNKKSLEKYQRHKKQKGIKGFFNRLFD